MEQARLWEQYDRALAEYRFQVELNWKRTQYFFALNTAVVAAGIALLSSAGEVEREVLVALFVVGIALALFSVVANRVQHGYYRESRELIARLEQKLDTGDLAIRTTPGMGSERPRWRRVQTLQEWMLLLIAAVNLTGLLVTVC